MGVDPGSRVTGYGVVAMEGNRLRCVDFGVIRPPSSSTSTTIAFRLKYIFHALTALIRRHAPEVVAVENVFYATNVRSALTLGHVRGVVLLAAENEEKRITEFSPLEIKQAVVGYGRADKQQVQLMVRTLLGLDEIPEPNDAADALAIAICELFNRGGSRRRTGRRWKLSDFSPGQVSGA